MKTVGRVFVPRSIFDDEVFGDAPYSEREAWLWLVMSATFRETTINVANRPCPLKRGELVYALRFYQQAWNWESDKKVRTFLEKLSKWGRIERKVIRFDQQGECWVDAKRGQFPRSSRTLITIVAYDKIVSPNIQDDDIYADLDANGTQRGRNVDADKNKE